MRRIPNPCWLLLAATLILTAWALWPGLKGGFLFDDASNLDPLSAYGPVDTLPALARYATSGAADPTGRPLAMLSFLVDGRHSPNNPYPFKRTNLALHLLNGLLLFAALAQIGRTSGLESRRACRTAVLATALWILHPLFVSTTMYIVQREAMLPATFTFAAIWAWLALRRRLLAGHDGAAWWMAFVVLSCTALATLSKANGVLLPSLLLVVECCLPTSKDDATRLRRVRRWLLWAPTLLVFAVILVSIPGSMAGADAHRPWTLWQRLLTESRVLFGYLGELWLPRPFSPGLFNDGLVASRDLLSPWTTLPSVIGVIVLAWVGWRLRTWAGPIAMAICFYLVGQSIESGPFPLELYFEHRNYLPAALMFWPLAVWLTASGGLAPVRTGLAIALPLLLAAETRINAKVWGDPTEQALLWGERNPDSPRAQAYAAQYELRMGHAERAESRLRLSLQSNPTDLQLLVNLAGTRCALGSLAPADLAAVEAAFEHDPDPTRLGFKWLERTLPMAKAGTCKGLGMTQADALAHAFARNPRTSVLPGRRSDAEQMLGEIALTEGRFDDARIAFDDSFNAEHRLDMVLVQSAILASAHQPEMAMAHLRLASAKPATPWYQWRSMIDVNGWIMYRQGFWQQQIDDLRGKIAQDVEERHDGQR